MDSRTTQPETLRLDEILRQFGPIVTYFIQILQSYQPEVEKHGIDSLKLGMENFMSRMRETIKPKVSDHLNTIAEKVPESSLSSYQRIREILGVEKGKPISNILKSGLAWFIDRKVKASSLHFAKKISDWAGEENSELHSNNINKIIIEVLTAILGNWQNISSLFKGQRIETEA